MDFRFHKTLQHWLETNGYLGKIDEIAIAGASHDIVSPQKPFHKDALMRQIDLSIKLHDPEEIIICDHEDCGGYKDLIPDGTTREEDIKKHKEYLKQAREILKELYPDKKIKTFYLTLDKEIKEFE